MIPTDVPMDLDSRWPNVFFSFLRSLSRTTVCLYVKRNPCTHRACDTAGVMSIHTTYVVLYSTRYR
jgi:hypothetical protein